MSVHCYLCAREILASQKASDDHVIPATLIERSQPKAVGFDYGGKLRTHEDCNNRFGPETYVSKALDLLAALHHEDTGPPLQHRVHAEIAIQPLNADRLSHFTTRDFAFFNLIDARQYDVAALSDPRTFDGRAKSNPTKDALMVALSVLAKSAAALLVKRHLPEIPPFWRILANPYTGDLKDFDLSKLVGETKPFDTNLRVWVIELPAGNWHVVYAAKDALVFFTFVFRDRVRALRVVRSAHENASTFAFLGATLNELLVAGWREILCVQADR